MGLVSVLVDLVVEPLVVGFGVYLGAGLVVGEENYRKAVVTALTGSAAYWLVQLVLGWIPLLGSLAALVTYLAVVKVAYDAGWPETFGIAAIAWVALQVVSLVLGSLLGPLGSLGI